MGQKEKVSIGVHEHVFVCVYHVCTFVSSFAVGGPKHPSRGGTEDESCVTTGSTAIDGVGNLFVV